LSPSRDDAVEVTLLLRLLQVWLDETADKSQIPSDSIQNALLLVEEVFPASETTPSQADCTQLKQTLRSCLSECGIDTDTSGSALAKRLRKHCDDAERRIKNGHLQALDQTIQEIPAREVSDSPGVRVTVKICTDNLEEGKVVHLGVLKETDKACVIYFMCMVAGHIQNCNHTIPQLYRREMVTPPNSQIQCMRCSEVKLMKPIPESSAAEFCLVNRSKMYFVAVICHHSAAPDQNAQRSDKGVIIDLEGDLDEAIRQKVQTGILRYNVGNMPCESLGTSALAFVKPYGCDVRVLVI